MARDVAADVNLGHILHCSGRHSQKGDATAGRVNLVVVHTFRERAQFIDKLLIPRAAHDCELALLGSRNEWQCAREFIPVHFDGSKSVSEELRASQ